MPDDKKLRLRVSNILKPYEDKPTHDFAYDVLKWGEVGESKMFLGFMIDGQLTRESMNFTQYEDKKLFKEKVITLFEKWLNKKK